jgi:LPS sulfotransferase NodH
MTALPAPKGVSGRPRHIRKMLDLRLRIQRLQHQLGLAAGWWLRRHTPYQPVFVLATHRSGSNLLIDYMNRLRGVQCHSEVLCLTLPYGLSPAQCRPEVAVRHLRRSMHTLTAPVRGCKLMLDQLADCGLTLDALDQAFPGAKYLILYRSALAEQFLSRQAAKVTDQWVLLDGQERKEARIHIDAGNLRAYCADIRQAYREILDHAWLSERGVLLSYEQLAADPVHCMSEWVCPLLDVPASQPETMLRKQNVLPLEQRVANYREVSALLASPLCHQHYTWSRAALARKAA